MVITHEELALAALYSPAKSPLRSFVRHVVVSAETDCWLWMSSIDALGYGRCDKRTFGTSRPHRAAYEQWVGPIPDGLQILHSCDVRNCVNPDHLRAGTAQENMADMTSRGRSNRRGPKGERNGQAKLTVMKANAIRWLCVHGRSQASVARQFGLSPITISRVVRRETWT